MERAEFKVVDCKRELEQLRQNGEVCWDGHTRRFSPDLISRQFRAYILATVFSPR